MFILAGILVGQGVSIREAVARNTGLDTRSDCPRPPTVVDEEISAGVHRVLHSGSLDFVVNGPLRSALASPVVGMCLGEPVTDLEVVYQVC